MLISFVIPAYNSSKTIHRCLKSIYSLPLKGTEFEVFAIDDCSTDNTVELLKNYQKNHANLIVYCQPQNHRQGAARNIGVDKATGDIIVFVDSDDEVDEGLLKAVKRVEDFDLDMVIMRVAKVSLEGKVESEMSLPYQEERVFSGIELQTEHPFFGTAPWPYVYRKSFLKKVNYPFAEDVLYEDSDFVNVHLFYATRMMYCDECGYVVHYNSTSTTHTLSSKHLCDYALLGTRMLKFYESIEDKASIYADGILEGGSYNIMKAFNRLFRLKSSNEVRAFYDRFDSHYDRKLLLGYHKPSYCWTRWTRFCLKHREMAIIVMGVIIPFAKIRERNK
jgi:glycosyltransferase involved in cell wall biosynthesis